MKVLALVIVVIASASGLGSGPYLPSGWKPQGPAFYLPSEVQKPAENPLKDTILQETEASGSDALREYGPPKVTEVSQDLTRQALPDAVTEQAFAVIEAKYIEEANAEVAGEVKEVAEVKTVEEETVDVDAVTAAVEIKEQNPTEESVTEAIEITTAVQSEAIVRAIDVSIDETAEIQEATTESVKTTTSEDSSEAANVNSAEADSNVESTQVEQVSQVQETEVAQLRTSEEGVKNVIEALINLDNEIKAQQVEIKEESVEGKSVQDAGQEAPEGFLEYGPPGFREYGPPQADELSRSAAVVQPTEEEQKIENNETRRRRFSPKFRSSKKLH